MNARHIDRRRFVALAGTSAAGVLMTTALSDDPGTPRTDRTGTVLGMVQDLQGVPQPGIGEVILMDDSGRHVGPRLTPDAQGRFSFDISEGDYQIRFHASGQAITPEPHPIRFTVTAGQDTSLTVRSMRGDFTQNQVEIYTGDGFYQMQPDGAENAETVVKLGTIVCWCNVGRSVHTVTGGPWVDSGDLQQTQSYIWVANQVGVFPYVCKYTQPQMHSTLRVVA